MTKRLPRHGDHYVIRAARNQAGMQIPRRWLLSIDPPATDDAVILPVVYFRPKRTPLGIIREAVVKPIRHDLNDLTPSAIRYTSQAEALAACRALQAHFAPSATRSDVTA